MNPIAMIAFASEPMAVVPTAPGQGPVAGAETAFATALMDAETVPQEEEAPVQAQPKADRSVWFLAARQLSVSDLDIVIEPETKATDEAVPVFVGPAPADAHPPSPLTFGFPSLDPAPTVHPDVDIRNDGMWNVGDEQRSPHTVPAANEGIGSEIPLISQSLHGEVKDEEIALPQVGLEKHEKLATPYIQASDSATSEATSHPEIPRDFRGNPQVSAQRELPQEAERSAEDIDREATPARVNAHVPAASLPDVPPTPATLESAPAPSNHEPHRGPIQRSDRTDLPTATIATPSRIALDALIRPDAPSMHGDTANAPTEARSSTQRVTTGADTGRQDFTGSNEHEANGSDSPVIEPVPQHRTSLETAIATHDQSIGERSGLSGSVTRESTAAPRTQYVEVKELANPASAPLKRMEVRIPDPHSNVVVQVQEHKGAVQVTVRTDDARTAGDIATHLPELTKELGQQGFRADTWIPDGSVDGGRSGLDLGKADVSEHTSSDTAGEHPSGKHREGSQSDQRRRKAPQNDFEEYLW